jgi:hypothetical protein
VGPADYLRFLAALGFVLGPIGSWPGSPPATAWAACLQRAPGDFAGGSGDKPWRGHRASRVFPDVAVSTGGLPPGWPKPRRGSAGRPGATAAHGRSRRQSWSAGLRSAPAGARSHRLRRARRAFGQARDERDPVALDRSQPERRQPAEPSSGFVSIAGLDCDPRHPPAEPELERHRVLVQSRARSCELPGGARPVGAGAGQNRPPERRLRSRGGATRPVAASSGRSISSWAAPVIVRRASSRAGSSAVASGSATPTTARHRRRAPA